MSIQTSTRGLHGSIDRAAASVRVSGCPVMVGPDPEWVRREGECAIKYGAGLRHRDVSG